MALATKTKKTTIHHKKRQAKHHRQSKRYLKAYSPYLPIVAVLFMGLVINTAWSKVGVLGVSQDFSSNALLSDTNTNRSTQQEAALTLDPQLTAAAQAKADDMVQHNYWSHTAPDGKTPWSFIAAAGYPYQTAGENLAYGFQNADEVITGWMNSPEHRANILNTTYQNVGFGVAHATNYRGQGPATIVVAEYGQPVDAAANITFTVDNPPAPVAPKVQGAKTELAAKPVSRIQLLTGGNANWSLAVTSALAGAALMLFVIRNGLRIHRLVSRGEEFIVHHPYVDIVIISIVTIGFILSRTSGMIR